MNNMPACELNRLVYFIVMLICLVFKKSWGSNTYLNYLKMYNTVLKSLIIF